MNLVVQNAITIGLVIAAVGYVLWQAWRVIATKKSGCGGGCRRCAINDDAPEKPERPFVSADDLKKSFRG